ncbi:MAG: NAD-dependent epimerase/dehydratase family protein [Candidatus Liptonbacteria bacterium]|nr:NAD-dependent epimerase/dehydratase family protein [Candidatus Liptonbacteria bacterium]
MDQKFKKFLVTGGAGFIGSHLIDRLIKEGAEVAVVDNLSTGRKENLNPRAAFYEMDACDESIKSVFEKEKPDVVYALAFNTNVPLSVRDPLFDLQSVTCSLNTFVRAREYGVKKIILASSSFIYGNTDRLPVTEEHLPQPVSPYAIAKIATENYLTFFHKAYGLPMVILRYGTVYGPRQVGGALADYIRKISKGERAEMYGDGNLTRDYVYVDDIVAANLKALDVSDDHPSPIFNLGSNKEITLNALYAMIAKLLNAPDNKPVYRDARPGEMLRFAVSYEKAKRELNWQPTVALPEGLVLILKHDMLI